MGIVSSKCGCLCVCVCLKVSGGEGNGMDQGDSEGLPAQNYPKVITQQKFLRINFGY